MHFSYWISQVSLIGWLENPAKLDCYVFGSLFSTMSKKVVLIVKPVQTKAPRLSALKIQKEQ